jgi:hypothetical protein
MGIVEKKETDSWNLFVRESEINTLKERPYHTLRPEMIWSDLIPFDRSKTYVNARNLKHATVNKHPTEAHTALIIREMSGTAEDINSDKIRHWSQKPASKLETAYRGTRPKPARLLLRENIKLSMTR